MIKEEEISFVTCEECGDTIATISGGRFEWLDNSAGVSEKSCRELCGNCLDMEEYND